MTSNELYLRLMRDNAATIVVQRLARGYLARMAYKKKLNNIVIVQSCVRRYLAKKELKRLKTEARSVEHVKSLNKVLENKIISMQHKIIELTKEIHLLKTAPQEVRRCVVSRFYTIRYYKNI